MRAEVPVMGEKPIKALVGAIQKFSTEDGPGIRTTVFLKGCPLDCKWCHNPRTIAYEQQVIEMPNSCIKCGYCLTHCPENAICLDEEGASLLTAASARRAFCAQSSALQKALRAVAKEMTAAQGGGPLRGGKGSKFMTILAAAWDHQRRRSHVPGEILSKN